MAYSHLSSKGNTCEQLLYVVSTQLAGYVEYFPKLSSAAMVNSVVSDDFTVAIKKLPAEVKNPARCKKLLDSISGHESMTSV